MKEPEFCCLPLHLCRLGSARPSAEGFRLHPDLSRVQWKDMLPAPPGKALSSSGWSSVVGRLPGLCEMGLARSELRHKDTPERFLGILVTT